MPQSLLPATYNLRIRVFYENEQDVSINAGSFSLPAWLPEAKRRASAGANMAQLGQMVTMSDDVLTEDQQQAGAAALDMGDLNALPAGNRAIIEYLLKNFVENGELKFDGPVGSFELEGTMHGTGDMQCKEWLDDIVIAQATGVNIPANNERSGVSGKWSEDTYQIGEKAEGETFQAMFDRVGATTGDIVQMYGTFGLHTMAVGKVQEDGIWVFDTNWGEHRRIIATTDVTRADRIFDTEINAWRDITENEKQQCRDAESARQPLPFQIGYYQYDNTVRYHFMSFARLNENCQKATIQQIPHHSDA